MIDPRFGLVVLGVYGVLLIVGGVMGFVKAKSRASLIAGTVSGLVAFAALGIAATYNASGGFALALALGIAMFLFFGPRAMTSRKFMPSGLMVLASAVVIGVMVWSIVVGPGV